MKTETDIEPIDLIALKWYTKGMQALAVGNEKDAQTYCNFLWGAREVLFYGELCPVTAWYIEQLVSELSNYLLKFAREGLPLDYAGSLYKSTEQDFP